MTYTFLRKVSVSFLIISAFLAGLPLLVFGQTAQADADDVSAGALPGTFGFIFDRAGENIRLAFIGNPEKETRLRLQFADERLAELEVIFNKDTVSVRQIARASDAAANELAEADQFIQVHQDDLGNLTVTFTNELQNKEDAFVDLVTDEQRDLVKEQATIKNEMKKLDADDAAKLEELTNRLSKLEESIAVLKTDITDFKKQLAADEADGTDITIVVGGGNESNKKIRCAGYVKGKKTSTLSDGRVIGPEYHVVYYPATPLNCIKSGDAILPATPADLDVWLKDPKQSWGDNAHELDAERRDMTLEAYEVWKNGKAPVPLVRCMGMIKGRKTFETAGGQKYGPENYAVYYPAAPLDCVNAGDDILPLPKEDLAAWLQNPKQSWGDSLEVDSENRDMTLEAYEVWKKGKSPLAKIQCYKPIGALNSSTWVSYAASPLECINAGHKIYSNTKESLAEWLKNNEALVQ